MKDSAGTEKTDAEVRKLAMETARQMAYTDLLDLAIEAGGGLEWLPQDMTRCECHGLWYDACEVYR